MDTARTVDELLACFGLRAAEVEPVADGPRTRLRVCTGGATYFLKIVTGECRERGIRSQIEYMDHLRVGGVPVVEIVPAHDGRSYATTADGQSIGILTRWIEAPSGGSRRISSRSAAEGRWSRPGSRLPLLRRPAEVHGDVVVGRTGGWAVQTRRPEMMGAARNPMRAGSHEPRVSNENASGSGPTAAASTITEYATPRTAPWFPRP